MATTILLKHGTSSAIANYTGPVGEVVVDVTDKTLKVMDGSTAGGSYVTARFAVSATYDSSGRVIGSSYLPLTGGKMNGSITADRAYFLNRDVDTDHLVMLGSTQLVNGGGCVLFGKDWGDQRKGGFELLTGNGSAQYVLRGVEDGRLYWSGQAFIAGQYYTSINCGTWVDSANGLCAIKFENNINGGEYSPLWRYKTPNGAIILTGYQNGINLAYVTNADMASGTNNLANHCVLMDESGNAAQTRRVHGGAFIGNNMDSAGECCQFRAIHGRYGVMIRNDGSNTWFLVTNPDDQYGSWSNNTGHPFWFNNENHVVTFGVGCFAPYFQISSDVRLKSDLKPIEDSVNKLSKLTGYTYDFKDSDKRRAGLVAQDVEKVLPEAVGENTEGYKTIEYSSVTALLVNAVNTLAKRVAELESKLQDA